MFWWIMGAVLLALGIACFFIEDGGMLGFFLVLIGAAWLILTLVAYKGNIMEVETWNEVKTFYEADYGKDNSDIGLTSEIISRNRQLAYNQWRKENRPFFSLYPDEVLDLEPIE